MRRFLITAMDERDADGVLVPRCHFCEKRFTDIGKLIAHLARKNYPHIRRFRIPAPRTGMRVVGGITAGKEVAQRTSQ